MFKKIKDLETDEGREIHIPEFDENQLPAKFLEQFVKTPTKRKKSNDFVNVGGNLTMSEQKRAIKKVRPGKAPGPDGIHGIMLKNLSVIGMDFLLVLFNESWLTSRVGSGRRVLSPRSPRNDYCFRSDSVCSPPLSFSLNTFSFCLCSRKS